MSAARVDLVIPIHDTARPIRRAVASVLEGTIAPVRVTVVAHNVSQAEIARGLGAYATHPQVRLRELHDGIRSPAGPFNLGLDAATAPFTSVMGSDDTLERGAVDAWLRVADRERASVVIARLRHASGRPVPTPPARPLRTTALDGVRDRLSYRSAPLGLVSTAAFGSLRFSVGRSVGEDVSYVTRLWFSPERIAYARRSPAYLLHDDGPGRTTVTSRPIRDELAYFDDVLGTEWFGLLSAAQRSAFCVKAIRIHLFGAVANRPDPTTWTAGERADLRERATLVLAAGGGTERVLSRSDRHLLDAILDPGVPAAILVEAARLRRRRTAPSALVPRRLRYVLDREAPLRLSAASALQLI
ncbi:glycosyltransferase family A protein [Microbacterium thalassium]|uniref:glycosyltransferase family A protein n=1 Tax=Microbacterium TaxID=33882 RepID=UPI00146EBABC|nr:glycosyltransferase family A protein [Microbacterium thalassium]